MHPSFQQQPPIKGNDHQSSFERQLNFQNDSTHPGYGASYNAASDQNTPGEQSRFPGLQYPRTSSCNRDNSRPTEFEVQDNNMGGVQVSTVSRRGRDHGYVDAEDHIYCANQASKAQPGYHNLRSKSHDRSLGASNSQLVEDKLEHSISNGAID